ncbi:MAG: hypothetical protein AB1689_13500 [Thermodesulfobacteriota bacterium]
MISRSERIDTGRTRALRALALLGALLAPLNADALVLRADFDGNGREDLVVGSPFEDVNGSRDAGAVSVFYGKAGGLPAEPSLQWHQDTPGVGGAPGIAGVAETDDTFATTVAVGDFNRDGFDDLAVGVPQEALPAGDEVGAVNVVYGSAFGLQLRGNHLLTLGRHDVSGARFGDALAVGDFDGDGYEDLAVGASHYTPSAEAPYAGAVKIFRGGPTGLARDGLLTLGNLHRPGDSHNFGTALASADFDRDGFDDLAIGIPHRPFTRNVLHAGAIEVLYGGTAALGGTAPARSHYLLDHGSGTSPEFGDEFGAALAVGNFNCDSYPDLAVGHPGEDGNEPNKGLGAVTIIYGTRFGASGGIRDYWPAIRAGMPGTPERGDEIGHVLAAADFNFDGCGDLAIGVPFEDQERVLGDRPDVGHVIVLDGSGTGLRAGRRPEWHQDSSGVGGSRGSRDYFGMALSAGDFNHDGVADLAIGVPGEKVRLGSTIVQRSAGIVQILHGTAQGLAAGKALGRQTFGEATKAGRASAVERDDFFGWALP